MMHRGEYYRKILLYYLIAVSVPVFALCMIIYNISVVQLREEIKTSQMLLLTQASETLARRFQECDDMSLLICMDSELIRLSEDMLNDQLLSAISLLEKYRSGNSFFTEIIVRRQEQQLVYTSQGTVYQDVLLTQRYHFTAEEQRQFDRLCESGKKQLYYFSDAGIIMNFVPMPVITHVRGSCVVFVIDRDALTTLFALRNASEFGAILLVDSEGSCIYEMDPNGVLQQEGLREAAIACEKKSVPVGKTRYEVISSPVPNVEWRFLSIVPHDWLYERMHSAILIMRIAFVLALAAALVLYLSGRLYRPIGDLNRKVLNSHGIENDALSRNNEVSNIDTALYSMEQLRSQSQEQKELLRTSLLARLLCGDRVPEEQLIRVLGMNSGGVFWVAAVHARQEPANYPMLMRSLRQRCGDEGPVWAVEMDSDEVVAVIINAPDNNGRYADIPFIGQEYIAGIGRRHPFDELSVSYTEAIVALEHIDQAADECVLHFSQMSMLPQFDGNFQRSELLYIQSIRQGNAKQAFALLADLMNDLRKRYTQKSISQYYQFHLAEAISQLLMEYEADMPQRKDVFSGMLSEMMGMLSSGSIERYEDEMHSITDQLLECAHWRITTHEDQRRKQIMDWLQQNLCDPLLSLDMISDAMGYSTAYWSRYFSEELGESFSAYVWRCRLEIVKRELVNGTLPIRDLVIGVGYQDVSSFIRRFKQEVGVTPGQYRKSKGTPEIVEADNEE